ncbi:DNA polymerase III subunits gamma and tau [Salinisphaera dokdonensis CL-ES53]|uniref:DNA polymerase III subunit gamma/tau n=1 Tax=Salinisphaera dokdonensis CL-ES53 TaxID=1304272 RepID=A0ABV2AVX0_9GAMM
MSFQALARTWRPRRFDELVGQAHVVRALTHALEQDKLHHALLFSGTRGVGKTTLARIIAKCLNCENGTTAHPCRGDDACSTCREIDEGRFVDLIEVDAASRTGVDDTRELMDNVQYAPTRGRTKVYLIDEVHMLSKHSFNALLKTLEEPPPRVQFLLATTEPEKIPVTILSRCLQFPLKRLPVVEIGAQLRHIMNAEALEADDEALTEVARAADGSMRDGLSLLDQAIAFSGGRLEAEPVRDMLGTIGQGRVAELVEAIVDARAGDALDALAALYAQGIDMRYLLEALATAWQQIATIHVVGEATDEAGEAWEAVAQRADTASVHVFYDIAVAGARDLAYAPDPLVGVKMSVLRMLAFAPAAEAWAAQGESGGTPSGATKEPPAPKPRSASSGVAQVRAQLQKPRTTPRADEEPRKAVAVEPDASAPANADGAAAPVVTPTPAEPQVAQDAPPQPDTQAPEPETPSAQSASPNADGDDTLPAQVAAREVPPAMPDASEATPEHEPAPVIEEAAPERESSAPAVGVDEWHALVSRLGLGGFAAQLANNGVCQRLDDERVVLALARANEFLAIPSARDTLQDAIGRQWAPSSGPKLVIEFVEETRDTPAQRIEEDAQARQQAAVASIENDPFVQQLRDRMGAQLRAETIKPHRPSEAIQKRDEL